ncbi:MAG TPA: amino acid permease [Methylomusa anaerophila]|uniref:GABA permease n=1 Tax=Methylomusa anaerophila TaxID=1930071 RepID=A0A348ALU6_9FIRM|nr:amino acid permease [Methylomusa anaerophila]BBB92044.1 GABA permease [Methylomusa anaerophila]HML87944.1 amino acid permease [Methylomusa anaerophila]
MNKGLSAWQLTMMALGTVFGGAFFLGSAVSVKTAGPAIIICYLLAGALIYAILFSLSEMTVAEAAPGSFRVFAQRAYGPGVGFVVGWVYWTGLVLAMSSEATAAAILIKTWLPGISIALAGSAIIIAVTLLNLLGADRLSKLESGLAVVKVLSIVGFILLGAALVGGFINGVPPIGISVLTAEPWFPAGLGGIAGSMLIVVLTFAGFEIIGLAAAEARDPARTVPQAIRYTVAALVGLYVLAFLSLLLLIPTAALTDHASPLVAALTRWGLTWAGAAMNVVLITAILSTMLAAMFGLGRMIRSLAADGHAPAWIKDESGIPRRGILFSGAGMLAGMTLGLVLPETVYLFLISSGGFSLLFSYLVILATHYKFRKLNGCPPAGHCQLPGYPYTSWLAMVSCTAIIASMPLVPGQRTGLVAGVMLVLLYTGTYFIRSRFLHRPAAPSPTTPSALPLWQPQFETSEELQPGQQEPEKKTADRCKR